MLIFWRKQMVEYKNDRDDRNNTENRNNDDYRNHCDCECCHCKKIFMLLVLLILVFMAGIMVGNCGRCRYADHRNNAYNYGYNQQISHNNPQKKAKKIHRGMQPVTAPTNIPANIHSPTPYQPNPDTIPAEQMGGFIIEVDQAE